MSKLKELMQTLCPNGVEYKRLGEVAEIGTGRSNRQDAKDDGIYPFYVRSKEVKRIDTYEFDEEAIIIPGEGGIGEIFHYIKGKYALHQRAYRIHFLTDTINTKFAYYYFFCTFKKYIYMKAVSATVTSIRKPMIEGFEIPVPPREVQEEIVRILDKFTELEAELEAELECRKRQYQHYRDSLLNFTPPHEEIKVEYKRLGEIGKVCMCKRIMKNETSRTGDVPFYKIGTFGKEADAYISNDVYLEYKGKFSYPKKGDVLISAAGTIGRAVIYDGKPAYFQDSNIVWIDNDENLITNKFLYYIYQTTEWQTEGSTIKRLYNENLMNLLIPIPPIEEQRRIVEILDKFEALTTDLCHGLPAEIEARRKQYEHYRDQLLTFKRLTA